MTAVPAQADGARNRGGRPPLPRFYVTATIVVEVGAVDPDQAERRAELLLGHSLGTVNPKRAGRPRVVDIHTGHARPAGG